MLFPLRDENPHPPGFKPKVTISLIIINAIVFFIQKLLCARQGKMTVRKGGGEMDHRSSEGCTVICGNIGRSSNADGAELIYLASHR